MAFRNEKDPTWQVGKGTTDDQLAASPGFASGGIISEPAKFRTESDGIEHFIPSNGPFSLLPHVTYNITINGAVDPEVVAKAVHDELRKIERAR